MTDRELLELAAKAAGMKLVHAPDDGPLRGCQFIDGKSAAWNPLINDSDAMRLAVKLRLPLSFDTFIVEVGGYEIGAYSELGDDHYAATRRAIVRAAAEVGKAMP